MVVKSSETSGILANTNIQLSRSGICIMKRMKSICGSDSSIEK